MKVVVESEEEFNAWLNEQQEFIDTMEPLANRNAEVEGEEVAQVQN